MLQKKFWSVSNRFSVKLVQSVGGILGIADYRSSLDLYIIYSLWLTTDSVDGR